MKFHVPDMSCGHCTAAITAGIQAADPEATVTTDLAARSVTVESSLGAEQLRAVLAQAGYSAQPAD